MSSESTSSSPSRRLASLISTRYGRLTLFCVVPLALVLTVYLGVYFWVRLSPVRGISPEGQAWIMSQLRAAAEGRKLDRCPSTLRKELSRRFPGPVFVELYLRGKVVFRHVSRSSVPLVEAIDEISKKIMETPSVTNLPAEDLSASRFKVDLTTAKGPLVTWFRLLMALSVVPGIDGLGLRTKKRVVYITPDELLRRNLVTGFKPFKFVNEFKAGLHIDAASRILAHRAGQTLPKVGQLPSGDFFRFRTFGFVEAPPKSGSTRGQPLPVFRGNTPPPRFNRKAVIDAILAGGRYILRMMAQKDETVPFQIVVGPDGRRRHRTEQALMPGERVEIRQGQVLKGQFRYIYFPLTDNYLVGGYSLPRHAGTTYGLALMAGKLKGRPDVDQAQVESFRKGAETAIEYLAERVRRGRCRGPDFVCVSLGPVTDLGSTALPVVAVMEYTRQTGDRRFLELGRQMANFLVFMQRPDGEFCHIYHLRDRRKDCKTILLYYSGEAALALAMAYQVLRDPKFLAAAKKGLDYQTGTYLKPLTMKFLYGEDHWVAMAADEIWPHVKKKAYADFAYGFAAFQQSQQFVPGETPFDDYVGGYGITPFFPPHLTPAGSRTEAAVSAYDLSVKRKEPRLSIKRQIQMAFRYIVTHQVRPENAYMFVNPATSDGAIRKSPVKYDVRIDYVQHTMAAMVRAFHLVPE